MALDPAAVEIAFRLGQIAALAQCHLAPDGLFTPEMRHALALRLLARAWAHYRQDRAITLGARLGGGECAAERDAFIALIAQALPPGEAWLRAALTTVRAVAVAPLADEARQTAQRLADSLPVLSAVAETLAPAPLAHTPLPGDPLERLLALIARHGYSLEPHGDGLSATAASPCWAINLLALARPDWLGLCALPCPGPLPRRLWRADLSPAARRDGAVESVTSALDALGQDIIAISRAARAFATAFPAQRRHSRLGQAWLLLTGLGEMTPAQLARALPATKAGAAKLLRQLETARFARCPAPYAPFAAVMR